MTLKIDGAENGFSREGKEMLSAFAERLRALDVENGSAKALAFWLRESNIKRMENAFLDLQILESSVRRPVGKVFQVAPSNVDLLFLYMWSIGVLLGNSVTTKLGSQLDSSLIAPVMESLNDVLHEFDEQDRKHLFVQWDRSDSRILEQISEADVVVGWGSDSTIDSLRQASFEAQSQFFGFPHRFSCSVINSNTWHSLDEVQRNIVLKRFVSEVSEFDQGACTSPKALVLVGEPDTRAEFLSALKALKASILAKQASGYLRFVNKVLLVQDSELEGHLAPSDPAVIEVIHGFESVGEINDLRCVLGILPVIEIQNLVALEPVLDRPIQTLSIWGFNQSEIQETFAFPKVHPLRIVRIGATHNFDFVWDGLNLLSALTWPQRISVS